MLELLKCSGFESYVIKLSSVYNMEYKPVGDGDVTDYLAPNDNDGKLLSLFASITSNTSKTDLLLRIRYL